MNYHSLYIDKFNDAKNKTTSEGYLLPNALKDFGTINKQRNNLLMGMFHKLFMSKLAERDQTIDFRKFKGHCLNIHTLIQPVLEKELGIKTVLTIGSININNGEAYKLDNIRNIIISSTNETNVYSVPIHAWLTLPSYEIVDLTIRPHIIYQNASEEDKIKYHKFNGFSFIFNNSDAIQE